MKDWAEVLVREIFVPTWGLEYTPKNFLKKFNISCTRSHTQPGYFIRASDKQGCRELEKLLTEVNEIKL
jgi:hypothetical protein